MHKKPTTPIAVQVARWTALAAAVTTLGSIVDTLWKYQPWWLASKTPTPKMTLMLAQMPEPNENFWNSIPAPVWVLVVSLAVLSWAWRVETTHRRKLRLWKEANPNA
jgi:hypothetical protein